VTLLQSINMCMLNTCCLMRPCMRSLAPCSCMHQRPDACLNAGCSAADALQPGSKLLAAAYALYSSATMLVLSVGSGAHGFTLDTTAGAFVCTHPHMRIPERGAHVGWQWPLHLHGLCCMRCAAGVDHKLTQHACMHACILTCRPDLLVKRRAIL
jgi:hypothetical protein